MASITWRTGVRPDDSSRDGFAMIKYKTSLCVMLAALGGCASVARQPDHAQLVAEVTAAENAFARTMADRDHAAFLTFIAEDAVFLGARTGCVGGPPWGKAGSGSMPVPTHHSPGNRNWSK